MPLLGCNRASATSTVEKPARRSRFSLFSRKHKAALKDSAATEPTAELTPAQEAAADPENRALTPEDLACLASTAAPSEASEAPAEAPAATAARAIAERTATLAEAALAAKAYRPACLALADLGTAVTALVQDHAAATTPASSAALERVASLLGDGAALATACAAPGWLLAAASPEGGACEAMAALHAGVLASIKESGLDRLSLLRLPLADYPTGASAARALNRRLRQLGGGSLREGLAVVATSEEEQRSLAAALGVEPEALQADAEHILEAGLAPPNTATAASAAAAGDAGVAAQNASLQRVFAAYATFGAREASTVGLDSFRCAKLCREAGLLAPGGGLTAQELDVLFAKAKDRASRKPTFPAFLRLLSLVASKKGVLLADVASAVAALRGPTATGATEPEYVHLHDDRSTYTGVHARGGMSVVDDKMELSKMVDRDAAEKASRRASQAKTPVALSRTASGASTLHDGGSLTPRGAAAAAAFSRPGVPRLLLPATRSGQTTPRLSGASAVPSSARAASAASRLTPPLSARGAPAAAAFKLAPLLSARGVPSSHALTPSAFQATPPPVRPLTSRQQGAEDDAALRRVFESFASFGKSAAQAAAGGEPSLDSAQLQKLCRDAELLSRQLTATRLDLMFAGTVGKGGRRLSYPSFVALLPRLAEARCCTEAEVVRRLTACQGPSRTATTTPQAVRLADKANFTGVAARGGPSHVDDRMTLASLTERK